MKNPNDPLAVSFYDWCCDRQDQIRDMMMQRVSSYIAEECEWMNIGVNAQNVLRRAACRHVL